MATAATLTLRDRMIVGYVEMAVAALDQVGEHVEHVRRYGKGRTFDQFVERTHHLKAAERCQAVADRCEAIVTALEGMADA